MKSFPHMAAVAAATIASFVSEARNPEQPSGIVQNTVDITQRQTHEQTNEVLEGEKSHSEKIEDMLRGITCNVLAIVAGALAVKGIKDAKPSTMMSDLLLGTRGKNVD